MINIAITLKDIAKAMLFRSGVLSRRHARNNRYRLTVAMFHRVLDQADPLFVDADPEYTVTAEFFLDCLQFFRRHYQPVSLNDVLAARQGRAPLPERPLLITFDDGWEDNLRYAAPLLQQNGIPAVVFLATDAVDSSDVDWWQERIFVGVRQGLLGAPEYRRIASALTLPQHDAAGDVGSVAAWLPVVAALAECPAQQRHDLLAGLLGAAPARRLMLTVEEMRRLPEYGIALGIHGSSHAPLTLVRNAAADLARARACVGSAAVALSYPHGRYDAHLIEVARVQGFELQFTSDPHLNSMQAGRPSDTLGRISITAPMVCDAAGALRPELLALWLFERPVSSARHSTGCADGD